jgi:hypothetical protein
VEENHTSLPDTLKRSAKDTDTSSTKKPRVTRKKISEEDYLEMSMLQELQRASSGVSTVATNTFIRGAESWKSLTNPRESVQFGAKLVKVSIKDPLDKKGCDYAMAILLAPNDPLIHQIKKKILDWNREDVEEKLEKKGENFTPKEGGSRNTFNDTRRSNRQ